MKSAADDNKYELPGAVDFTGVPANCGPAQYPVRTQVEILLTIYEKGGMDRAVLVSDILKATSTHVAAPELDVEAERREFEAWAVRKRAPYCDSPADRAQQWAGWQGRASSAAQGTAPAPAKPWPQVNAEAIAAQDLLDWNRSQGKRPIEITKELGVARKAFEFLAAAKVITAAQQANQAAPVSTEQAGDARDAARYRHIKADNHRCADNTFCLFLDLDGNLLPVASADMDAEIDAAMLEAAPSPNNSPVGADRRE